MWTLLPIMVRSNLNLVTGRSTAKSIVEIWTSSVNSMFKWCKLRLSWLNALITHRAVRQGKLSPNPKQFEVGVPSTWSPSSPSKSQTDSFTIVFQCALQLTGRNIREKRKLEIDYKVQRRQLPCCERMEGIAQPRAKPEVRGRRDIKVW
jgi:hypothetical protein